MKLTTRLIRAGVKASMGSVGDSYDNAPAENLRLLIKTECVRGRIFATRAEANLTLFEYIDGFDNSRRIQERLGRLSPIEFEEKHYTKQATAEPTNLNTRQPALTSRSTPTAQPGNLTFPSSRTPGARCPRRPVRPHPLRTPTTESPGSPCHRRP
ncbi:IS3 family transposase [Streptomyces sp. NPDC048419]|uniref:IS3 family transposase n=1 Tax=Streptomyces sp. NPDC048419 TaxID=3365547 RepID=UPI0037174C5D